MEADPRIRIKMKRSRSNGCHPCSNRDLWILYYFICYLGNTDLLAAQTIVGQESSAASGSSQAQPTGEIHPTPTIVGQESSAASGSSQAQPTGEIHPTPTIVGQESSAASSSTAGPRSKDGRTSVCSPECIVCNQDDCGECLSCSSTKIHLRCMFR